MSTSVSSLEKAGLNLEKMGKGKIWIIYPNIPDGPQELLERHIMNPKISGLKNISVRFLHLYAVEDEKWKFCSISQAAITKCQKLFALHRYDANHKGGAIYFPKGKTLLEIPVSERVLVVTQPGMDSLKTLKDRIKKGEVYEVTMSRRD